MQRIICFILLACVCLTNVSAKPAKQRVLQLKLGKKKMAFTKFNQSAVTKNRATSFVLRYYSENPKKKQWITFSFIDTDLRLGEYQLRGPANYIENRGDVRVDFGYEIEKKRGYQKVELDSDSSLVGTLNILEINPEKNFISAEFEFTTSAYFEQRKKRKYRESRKEIKVKKGKIKTNLEGIGKEIYLRGPSFFEEEDNTFLSDNKISTSSTELASINSNAKVYFELGNLAYYTDEVRAYHDTRTGAFTYIDTSFPEQTINGATSSSRMRFVIRNRDLGENDKFIFGSSAALNGAFFTRIPYIVPGFWQSFSNPEQGIELISLEPRSRLPYNIGGEMRVIEYDPSTGYLKIEFDFQMDMSFTNQSTEGYVKGPATRALVVKNGHLECFIEKD